jgi:hypothetical protein
MFLPASSFCESLDLANFSNLRLPLDGSIRFRANLLTIKVAENMIPVRRMFHLLWYFYRASVNGDPFALLALPRKSNDIRVKGRVDSSRHTQLQVKIAAKYIKAEICVHILYGAAISKFNS